MRDNARKVLKPIVGLVLFAGALWVLDHTLRGYHYHDILRDLQALSASRLFLAMALTLVNYLVLTGYDALAFRYIHRPLACGKIALTSFIGYAFSQSSRNGPVVRTRRSRVGTTLESPWSVDYRTTTEPAHVVLFVSGDGGWNLGVVDMARELATLDALVAGIDINHYLRELEASGERCSYPAADFEALSKFVQKSLDFPVYIHPEGAASDLARVLQHYMAKWKKLS